MSKKLWGGRFSKKTDPLVEEFTKSIHYDYKLAEYDLLGTMAHVSMLQKSGYLTSAEASKLCSALEEILKTVTSKTFQYHKDSEDIHTEIQNILKTKVGSLALKLHTARSRNDQVALATKLFCKVALCYLQRDIAHLSDSIKELAEKNKEIIIPGFTHLQHAQPVYLKEYFKAYLAMLKRDEKRLGYIYENTDLTMGAGALAGTPIDSKNYNIKIETLGKELKNYSELGAITPTLNSLDSVSDRDFVIEVAGALSILGMHLSRLAEDLILWSTTEFGYVEIDERFCTGSSLMPQKKNPDVLELIRGYAGRLYGNLISVLTIMKGLPLAYNRDMQLDKEPLFNSFEVAANELKVLKGLIKTLKFNKENIAKQLKDESLYATDLIYYLVNRGVAFEEAHTVIGELVKYSQNKKIEIKEMPENLLKKFSKHFAKKEIVKLFDPKVSVESKKSIKRQ